MRDICKKCNTLVEVENLIKDAAYKKGYRNRCKKCHYVYIYSKRGKQYSGTSTRLGTGKRLAQRQKMLMELRSVPCADCGQTFHYSAMDFDHLPGHEKKFGIMHRYRDYSMEVLLAEIAKCEVVCSNCHRYRTWVRRQ